jgi:hypothetical protein
MPEVNSTFTVTKPKTSCVLDDPDETSDVILEVEGRQLHANRAVLAHFSPVFQRMFYADFKEKEQKVVPLPGKKYDDMAAFFNVLYPPATPTSKCEVKGRWLNNFKNED